MQDALYDQLSEIDQLHWWHVGRRNLVRSCLDSLHMERVENSLDIGCGAGSNLSFLKEYSSKVTGLDASPVALKLAQTRFPDNDFVKADANHLKDHFKPQSFGMITIFNVLYHQWIKNDEALIKDVFDLLVPGGYVVITEPAHKFLMRHHDELDMGKTRYSLQEMKGMLVRAGFIVDKATYFNMVSFFPALLLKIAESILKPSQKKGDRVKEIELPPVWLNKFMLGMLNFETKLIDACGRLPTGLGVLCIAHKPK